MNLVDMTVKEYLETVASSAPAPGGGSASALCGAQGAGLAAMAAGLTLGKKKYPDDQELCAAAVETGKRLSESLTRQIDRDTEAFNLISAAFQLPKGEEKERIVRSLAIAEATLVATEVPYETLQYANAGLILVESLIGHFNTNCASDLGVAALNLLACARGAWLNVLINLPGVTEEAKAEEFRVEGARLMAECEQRASGAYEALRALIEG